MPLVLIVDDEPDIRAALKALLELEGFEVRAVENGAMALEQAADGGMPDVVLVDYMMPYMNGRDLARRLREEPATRRIPIVMMSAVEPAGEVYWDAFVRKPAHGDELVALLHRLAPGR